MNRKQAIQMAAAVALILALMGLALAEGETLQVKDKKGIGKYLTDGKGMTLYIFKNDKKDKNSCTGPCLEKWPIYYDGKVKAPAGSDPMDFREFTRADGNKQTTFKGWPLYYFVGDKAPGDTNGQGMNDVWYVINPKKQPEC